jgi:hypothetical protein
MGQMGTLEMPQYRWHFYNVHKLADLGLTVSNEDVIAGNASVDVDGNADLTRVTGEQTAMLLNWFMPTAPGGFQPAENFLAEVALTADDLTKNGGSWMPVLEPLTDYVPNHAVLGYTRDEMIWMGECQGNCGNGKNL